MLGAIIGDIAGSRFEFRNHRSKDFDIFHSACFFTDDTVMTCAVADCLVNNGKPEDYLKYFGRQYPNKGYGGRFKAWIFSNNSEPYYSFGNGAAMRVSPVGWFAKNEKEVKALSKRVTEVTHDHPEGLKGAEVTAMCIFYALHGKSKDFIRKYAKKYYNIDFDYEDLVKNYKFNERCQDTVPQAIYCFLNSNSFEDCLRISVSIGGDTDTLCAISCAIAEAYYGIPNDFKEKVMRYFNYKDKILLLEPLKNIYEKVGKNDYFML